MFCGFAGFEGDNRTIESVLPSTEVRTAAVKCRGNYSIRRIVFISAIAAAATAIHKDAAAAVRSGDAQRLTILLLLWTLPQ